MIDLDQLAKGVKMLGMLPNEHPQAATFNEALDVAASYLRSFIGREQYLPRSRAVNGAFTSQVALDEVLSLLLEISRAPTITSERAAEIREEAKKLYDDLRGAREEP